MYEAARPAVAGLSAQELVDLEHECQALGSHEEFTVRTGAHIVRAAALLALGERADAAMARRGATTGKRT